jgi:hypothetical protein
MKTGCFWSTFAIEYQESVIPWKPCLENIGIRVLYLAEESHRLTRSADIAVAVVVGPASSTLSSSCALRSQNVKSPKGLNNPHPSST